jgi:TetR/AcrR family fatty acid metabolism transcriptional regulator
MLILKQNRKFLETKAYNDVRELSRLILDVIEEGISSGEFKSDFNPYLVRAVILGAIEHMVIRHVLFGKPENLVGFVDQLTDLICSGITRLEEQRRWDLSVTVTPRKEPHNEKGSTRNE